MSTKAATVKYVDEKHCFITLGIIGPSRRRSDQPAKIYEVTFGNNERAYVSCSENFQESCANSSEMVLHINGIYANKLGIKAEETVLIRPLKGVPAATTVSIEPLSTDDWEMLENRATFVENNLLDQVRIVWKGQILPIWNQNLCMFLRIGSVEPTTFECAMLEDNTEVIVSPKPRRGHKVDSVSPHIPSLKKRKSSHSVKSGDSYYSSKTSASSQGSSEDTKNKSSSWSGISSFFTWRRAVQKLNESLITPPEHSLSSTNSNIKYSKKHFPAGLNFILRVQHSKCNLQTGTEWNKGSEEEEDPLLLLQPNLVFVNHEDLVEQSYFEGLEVPSVFAAKMTKLRSVSEEIELLMAQQRKQRQQESEDKDSKSKKKEPETTSEENKDLASSYVTVVVLDKKKTFSDKHLDDLAGVLLQQQACLRGHIIVPTILRRLMELPVTHKVWLNVVKPIERKMNAIQLHPVSELKPGIYSYMLQDAFAHWFKKVTYEGMPLLIYNNLALKIPIFHDVSIECQVMLGKEEDSQQKNPDFVFLERDSIDQLTVYVVNKSKKTIGNGSFNSLLLYPDIHVKSDMMGFDPMTPSVQLSDLGGSSEYVEKAVSHIETCLSATPLSARMFRVSTPGLRNGLILITGMKGCGKTSLAMALCKKFTELPYYAYYRTVDCRTLRGKKPDSILALLEGVLEEAVWRQPAIVLLDDLDHVIPAPDGIEAEMTPEGLYGARVAEAMKDLFRKEIINGSRIAIVATCVARTSINAVLTSSRGTHFVQESINLRQPNKKQREDILRKILEKRLLLCGSAVDLNWDDLNWDTLTSRTEGYVSKDLDTLVSRAIHDYAMKDTRQNGSNSDCKLTMDNFLHALNGFTPASIRNVSLHTAGDLGWEDVGGLAEVKTILQETLLLPSKYPSLFSNMPLRMRSGILLYGAPGTGKTLLAGVVAKECGLNFISIKGPELLSKYIGASEQAVRDTFNRAQSAKPCILFFDEFESIAPRRGHDNTGVTDRVVNQFLTQLDGVEGLDGVYVLAATSRPDLIDPALLRPGRLDKSLQCCLPNQEERLKILNALMRRVNLDSNVDLSFFAMKCEHFSGADLKALLYNAQLEAIHELTGKMQKDSKKQLIPQKSMNALRPGKNSLPLQQKVVTRKRHSSFSSQVTYIPQLEYGVEKEISEEMEDKLKFQVDQIKARLKVNKTTERISTTESLFSPVGTSKSNLMVIQKKHMLAALEKTSASVSQKERDKYERIYRNFVASRGGDFSQGISEGPQKQTLA